MDFLLKVMTSPMYITKTYVLMFSIFISSLFFLGAADELHFVFTNQLLAGSDSGSLRLYDISDTLQKAESSCSSSGPVVFDKFEQLTSLHVNSTDDQFLTSGYSKKVAIYDICSGKRLHLFSDMHKEPINVAKFAHYSPNLLVTSSFDRDVKLWDLRQTPNQPCYTTSSSRGNVMVCFSPDDLYLLVSAVDNEVP